MFAAGASCFASAETLKAVPAQPLQAVLDLAQDGDTVELTPGNYNGSIRIDRRIVLTGKPGAAVIEELTITSAPQHGSTSPRGRTGVIYRAHRNYRGEDSFAVALRGRASSGAGVAIIRVRVDVR